LFGNWAKTQYTALRIHRTVFPSPAPQRTPHGLPGPSLDFFQILFPMMRMMRSVYYEIRNQTKTKICTNLF